MYKPTGNPKVIELIKSIKDRSYYLGSIQPIKLNELTEKGKPKRLCAWCAEIELFHGNQKYCSNNCSNSAMATFYPQKEDALRFLLIRQDWKCGHCQFDYKPVMEQIIEVDRKRYGGSWELSDLPWHYFKRLKNRCDKANKPEIDHIIPIYKGGTSLGLENHKILCSACHLNKTKVDLSGKRTKNAKE